MSSGGAISTPVTTVNTPLFPLNFSSTTITAILYVCMYVCMSVEKENIILLFFYYYYYYYFYYYYILLLSGLLFLILTHELKTVYVSKMLKIRKKEKNVQSASRHVTIYDRKRLDCFG